MIYLTNKLLAGTTKSTSCPFLNVSSQKRTLWPALLLIGTKV